MRFYYSKIIFFGTFKAPTIGIFRVLETRHMARVDMFLTADNRIFVNEINKTPGFTAISMYPKLWQTSGIATKNLSTDSSTYL
jgi:D-alanine-D-alanine ligase